MLRSLVLFLILSIIPTVLLSQDGPKESSAYELTQSGEAYLWALRGSGVEADMTYFDPTQPAPELKLDQPIETPEEEISDTFDLKAGGDLTTTLITLFILGVMVWVFIRYGGAVTLSLKDPDNQTVGTDGAAAARSFLGGGTLSIDQVATIKDRRLALTALLSLVLRKAADDSDMAIERSWTARETARRLPANWPHSASLTNLIRDVELTYFGGRPADEAMFQSQLQAIRCMLQGAAS